MNKREKKKKKNNDKIEIAAHSLFSLQFQNSIEWITIELDWTNWPELGYDGWSPVGGKFVMFTVVYFYGIYDFIFNKISIHTSDLVLQPYNSIWLFLVVRLAPLD